MGCYFKNKEIINIGIFASQVRVINLVIARLRIE